MLQLDHFSIVGVDQFTIVANSQTITASRSISNPGRITIVNGSSKNLEIQPEFDEVNKVYFYKNENWKKLLGICFFGIKEKPSLQYNPSFRSLIAYFIRRGIDAYSEPFSNYRAQREWDKQLHSAFLLGLNWQHASTLQEIKDKEKAIKSINAALKAGLISSQGELEAVRIRLEKELEQERNAIASFKVYPQYQQMQETANIITTKIHEVTNQNLMLRRKLDHYTESIRSEHGPNLSSLEQLYEEAGLLFPGSLKRTLNDAKNFHITVIENRKKFLESEVLEITRNLANNDNMLADLNRERAEIMRILQNHGALEEFSLLQEKYMEKKEQLEKIKLKITEIKTLSARRKEIKSEKIELESRMSRDYEVTRTSWEHAVSIFNEISQALYNEPGNLIINFSSSGYRFDIEIARSRSEGVGKMKIFCYDLMLVEILASQEKINFLVHDSTMFDGVESRQKALALECAHKRAISKGFQYICTFNSDMLPTNEFSNGFNVQDYIRLHLYDRDDRDSLLGFRFNK